jgi:hypothetical protein
MGDQVLFLLTVSIITASLLVIVEVFYRTRNKMTSANKVGTANKVVTSSSSPASDDDGDDDGVASSNARCGVLLVP